MLPPPKKGPEILYLTFLNNQFPLETKMIAQHFFLALEGQHTLACASICITKTMSMGADVVMWKDWLVKITEKHDEITFKLD